MPRYARSTWPADSSCGITVFAVSIGTAKPIPTLPSEPLPVAICELIPIDAAARVEQRAARVARVERGVGLDHVVDPEPARRGQAALERRHHAGGERLLEPERVADRDRRVADLEARGAAELERVEVEPVGLDPQQREVGVGILADR